ncbi:MAG TPA: WG repeat-containing protein, partial [Pyrinomonadaceae bacterium]|nr:WG repeat-containing protein [Pyrinomonadaceae bacterium]
VVLLPGDKESFGFIDHEGKVVIRTNYSVVDDFNGGLAQVRQDDPQQGNDIVYSRYGYIDKTGKVIWTPTR